MEPLVCIILVNYNGYMDTVECVSSIERCNYRNFKIIIVDNASTDGSFDRLYERYSAADNIILVAANDNNGFSSGNNIGLIKAWELKSEYILLLNNDTVVDKCFLNIVRDQLEDDCLYSGKIYYYSSPDTIWFAGGDYNKYKGTASHRRINEQDIDTCLNYTADIDFICGCYVLGKSSVFKKCGFLPEEYFLYCEDLDYSLHAKKIGVRLLYTDKSVIYHKVSSSTSRIKEKSQYYIIRNRLYVIRKYNTGISKFTALVFSYISILKKIICESFSVRIFLKAVLDYKRGAMGKISNE